MTKAAAQLQAAAEPDGAPGGRYHVPALHTGLDLIRLLADAAQPLTLSAIAQAIGTNKNMATRLLATLAAEGWVQAEAPGPRYRLTLAPFAVASKAAQRLPLRAVGQEPLRRLWESTGQSVYLGRLEGDQVLYLDHLDGTGAVRVAGRTGGLYPLHCTAPGKALLAWAGPELAARLAAAGLKRFTASTLDAAGLAAELATIRRVGYALDREEYARGIICAAAPVRDASGQAVGAIGTSVTTLEFDLERLERDLLPPVIATAAEISRRLGVQP
jgi:IclR family acetate operon transcriptional repressor